jgi:hypothetical protein
MIKVAWVNASEEALAAPKPAENLNGLELR